MKYIYPAVITPENGAYLVHFHDFDNVEITCYTDGSTLAEALENGQDVLNLTLVQMEDEKMVVPVPSEPATIQTDKGAFVTLVEADTLKYREQLDERPVKKTLSIPKWLDCLAKKHKVNFSKVLQNALMQECGVS